MNLENINAVRARIEEIHRRFIDDADPGILQSTLISGRPTFQSVLRDRMQLRPVCPAEIEGAIIRAARKHEVDPALVKAVIDSESGFKADARSPAGALGLMQLMPDTARALGVDPLVPEENIDGGVRYLKQQIERFGSIELGLAAYNAGPGNVLRYGGVPPFPETQNYVRKVLDRLQAYLDQ